MSSSERRRFYREEYPSFWAGEAARYAAGGTRSDTLNLILSRLPADGAPVLDCCCGNGIPCWPPMERRCRLVGLDIARPLLEEAGAHGAMGRIEGDATRLPFADSAFGLSFSIRSSIVVSDFREVLEEMVRVTRPGGTVIVDVFNRRILHAGLRMKWKWVKDKVVQLLYRVVRGRRLVETQTLQDPLLIDRWRRDRGLSAEWFEQVEGLPSVEPGEIGKMRKLVLVLGTAPPGGGP